MLTELRQQRSYQEVEGEEEAASYKQPRFQKEWERLNGRVQSGEGGKAPLGELPYLDHPHGVGRGLTAR